MSGPLPRSAHSPLSFCKHVRFFSTGGCLTGEPCFPHIQHGASGSLTGESHNEDIQHGDSVSLRGEPHFEYGASRSLSGQPPFLLALFGSTKFCMTNDFNVRKIALYLLYSIQESFVALILH